MNKPLMSREISREAYFEEQARTARTWYRDYLAPYIDLSRRLRILEIGCGEGGNLLPFAEMGHTVVGIDLSEGKIDNARQFFTKHGCAGTFLCENILDSAPADDSERFDLILIHDVIEHIEQPYKQAFFEQVRRFSKTGALTFWAFPAWQMPFGGHQQICRSRLSKLPWIHLLPTRPYERLLRRSDEPDYTIQDLLSIKRSAMTAERFEKLCATTGLSIINRTLWLINPHYQTKFGLTPRRLRLGLDHIPGLRNFLSTSCFYLTRSL